jgi:hypothetical protein
MAEEPKKIEITQDLAQAILDYLALQPYKETFQLIGGLQAQASYSLEEVDHTATEEVAEEEPKTKAQNK